MRGPGVTLSMTKSSGHWLKSLYIHELVELLVGRVSEWGNLKIPMNVEVK